MKSRSDHAHDEAGERIAKPFEQMTLLEFREVVMRKSARARRLQVEADYHQARLSVLEHQNQNERT